MNCTQNYSTLPFSHSPWELEGSPGHLRQGAPASRSGGQIPQTKSQSCHVTATLGKSVGFFQVEFLPCSISLCDFQLSPRKTHRTSVSFSPTKQLHASHKIYLQPSTSKDKCREAPGRAREARGCSSKEKVSSHGLLSYLASKLPRVHFSTECRFSRWPSLSGTTFCVLSRCQQSDSQSPTKPKLVLLLQL